MFKDDIDLVREMIAKYGLQKPVVDLGGLRAKDITVADYDITIRTGDQRARYLKLNKDPFTDIVGEYAILNPEYGDPPIEQLSKNGHAGKYGTMVCLSTLEHMEHPFHAFEAFHELLQPGGLLILSTVFSFPVHGAPQDYWRFRRRVWICWLGTRLSEFSNRDSACRFLVMRGCATFTPKI